MGFKKHQLKRLFSAAALAAGMVSAGACATVTAAGTAGAAPEQSPPPGQQDFRLLMSATTRARLGAMAGTLERELPGWAQADVLLLTSADAVSYGDRSSDMAYSMQQLLSNFYHFPAAAIASTYDDYYLSYMFHNLQNGYPYAYTGFETSRKAMIILMADPGTEPKGSYAAFLSGVPDSLFRENRISSQEWFAMFLLHEAAHAGHKFNMNQGAEIRELEYETDADYQALIRYRNLSDLGLPYDRDLPSFLEAVRAIGSLRARESNYASDWTFTFSQHASNIALDVKESSPFFFWKDSISIEREENINPARMAAALVHVNDLAFAVLASVTKSKFTPHTRDDLNTRMGPFNLERSIIIGMLTGQDGLDNDLNAGRIISDGYPLLHYAAVKILHDKGFFAENSVERLIAREFIEAYETYIPQSHTSPEMKEFMNESRDMSDIFSHTEYKPQRLRDLNDDYYHQMQRSLESYPASFNRTPN